MTSKPQEEVPIFKKCPAHSGLVVWQGIVMSLLVVLIGMTGKMLYDIGSIKSDISTTVNKIEIDVSVAKKEITFNGLRITRNEKKIDLLRERGISGGRTD